jgi:hypothetical protein
MEAKRNIYKRFVNIVLILGKALSWTARGPIYKLDEH